jgi:RNA polymerase sigma factor (sigma-70 family)
MSMTTTTTQPAHTRTRPAPAGRPTSPLAQDVATCIRRHRAGDREAIADLTRQVMPWLHHVIRAYRLPRDTAEDVVQSTLLMALLHIDELRDPAAGLSWLSVVARREALRVIRADRRYIPVEEPESLHAATTAAAGPEEIVLAGLSRDVVRRTVAKLPPRYRVLLERTVISDGPSYATISAELEMPLGSIGPTRRRGLERMRRMLAANPEWNTDVPA